MQAKAVWVSCACCQQQRNHKPDKTMTTESIKAKIANNETLTQAEVDYLLEADIDALLDYEQAQRIAAFTA